jgi:7-alpha-hydroxysteroid dehydrogenase
MPREFTKTAPRHLEQAFQFNVATAHALTRAAVPLMTQVDRAGAGTGAVVNITSLMGRASGRGYLAYGTAKAALSHYTRLAARDLAPRIRVNAIGVGSIATSALEVVLTDPGLRTTMEETTPLRRIGDPDDIAAVALFLASDAAAYVTGTVVDADGGLDRPNLDLGFPDV